MLRVVRLGTPRAPHEGLRVGTVRRLPRGVRKEDYARRDFFDLWLPELAPSEALFATTRGGALADPRKWKVFARKYQAEMRKPAPQHVLALLAALSRRTDLSVGCYCEDESRCHRSVLKKLLAGHGAQVE